jgi:hypothetical protein
MGSFVTHYITKGILRSLWAHRAHSTGPLLSPARKANCNLLGYTFS